MSDSGRTKVTPIQPCAKTYAMEVERDGVKQNDGIEIHEHAEPSRRFTMSLENTSLKAGGVARRRARGTTEVLVHPSSLDNLAMFFGTPI